MRRYALASTNPGSRTTFVGLPCGAGVPERVAMQLTGHKTRAIFERYNIVSDGDLQDAARRLDSDASPSLGEASGVSPPLRPANTCPLAEVFGLALTEHQLTEAISATCGAMSPTRISRSITPMPPSSASTTAIAARVMVSTLAETSGGSA